MKGRITAAHENNSAFGDDGTLHARRSQFGRQRKPFQSGMRAQAVRRRQTALAI